MSEKTLTRWSSARRCSAPSACRATNPRSSWSGAQPHVRRAGARRDRQDLLVRHLQRASKSARVGRNPKTGEEVPIEPRRVLTFRPSHIMKERVDVGNKR